MSNVSAYEAIIARVVAMRAAADWRNGEQRLRELESDLKTLGAPADPRDRQRIWGDFSAARAAYRNARAEFFAARESGSGAARGRGAGGTTASPASPARVREQDEAKRRKKTLIGQLRLLLGGEPGGPATAQVKALGGEFFQAGYAGKEHNDALAAEFSSLRAEYFRKLGDAIQRAQEHRDRIARDMDHALFVLERIAHGSDLTDRWAKWTEASERYRAFGYPGKEKKAELDARFQRLRAELSVALERDKQKRQRQREAEWAADRARRGRPAR
ncbi:MULTISPECIES: hypothetical protein [unclassified Microbacterium]|uniref:hypothetical protein n=1 Tax=unclassified Microbacterium TaxID=2609290 RepID=UPI001D23910C|nr:hypothetical protein [Microbacterium sp. Bi121]CAH0211681.1 hypothetical protein SRABI121_02743 [Microbacterium sp. Bi121]